MLRSTRRLRLTPAGDRHVTIWREVLGQLGALEPTAVGGQVQGSLVLTAPALFGRMKLMPVLEPFLHDHPLLAARVLLLNRVVDLIGEGVDVAVRLAPLPDSTLTAIRLGVTACNDVRRNCNKGPFPAHIA